MLTFANHADSIHFRHFNFAKDEAKEKALRTKNEGETLTEKDVDLKEVGPRFTLQLYRIELGTLDLKDAKTEWVLRPFFNKQRDAL